VEGRYQPPISEEQKADFLDLICQGYSRPAAADAVDSSARRFRALCNPKSDFYDEHFATRYAALTEPGGEQEAAIVERIESAFIERAVKDSDRAAEKILAARDPRYAFLRPKTFTGQVSIEHFKVYLQGVPDEILQQLAEMEDDQKALPPGVPGLIDAA
jgi:hypothetical protein